MAEEMETCGGRASCGWECALPLHGPDVRHRCAHEINVPGAQPAEN